MWLLLLLAAGEAFLFLTVSGQQLESSQDMCEAGFIYYNRRLYEFCLDFANHEDQTNEIPMIEKRLNNEFIRFGRALPIKRKNEFIRFGRRKRSTDESNSALNLAPESNSALNLAPEHVEEKRMNDFIRFGKRMNMLVSMRYGKGSMQHGKQNRNDQQESDNGLSGAKRWSNEFLRFG